MSEVRTSGWVGWVRFAAVIVIISGIFSLLQGIVAVVGPNTYFVVANGSLFLFDAAGWGWWNIVIGALLVLVGFALLAGQVWARLVAVLLAIFSASVQLLLIPAQPWWAAIVIAVDVLVVYAIVAHGQELKADA